MLWLTNRTVRPSLGGDFLHFAEAFLLEFSIADGEHFVDDENFRIEWAATAKARRTYMPLE